MKLYHIYPAYIHGNGEMDGFLYNRSVGTVGMQVILAVIGTYVNPSMLASVHCTDL